MEANRIFGKSIALFERALNLRATRHRILVNNVANADTPQYRGFDLEVEKALAEPDATALKTTHPDHIGSVGSSSGNAVVELSSESEGADGNNVDLESSMANMAMNNLMYNALTQMTSRRFTSLKSVIRGGK